MHPIARMPHPGAVAQRWLVKRDDRREDASFVPFAPHVPVGGHRCGQFFAWYSTDQNGRRTLMRFVPVFSPVI